MVFSTYCFYFHDFFFIIRTLLYGRASLFHSFIQLLIYISVDLYVFGLLNHSNTLPFFFPAQIISILAIESHFKLASVSLWQVIIICRKLLIFLQQKFRQTHMVFLFSNTGISPCFKGSWFLE